MSNYSRIIITSQNIYYTFFIKKMKGIVSAIMAILRRTIQINMLVKEKQNLKESHFNIHFIFNKFSKKNI